MIRRLLAVLATVLLGLAAALALATPASAAPPTTEDCERLIATLGPTLDPSVLPVECQAVWQQQQAQQPDPTPTPTPTALQPTPVPTPQPTPGTVPTPGAQVPVAPVVYPDVVPETSAEEWAVEAGRSMHALLGELNRELAERPGSLGEKFARPYAVAWGLGLVLLAFSITVVTAQSAGGRPATQELLRSAGLRAWIYYPLMLVVPTITYSLYAWMGELAGWFGNQGGSSRSEVFAQLSRRMVEAESPAQLLTGGVLMALILPVFYVLLSLLILIEVTLAKYGLFVLVCLVPPLAALAIHPRFRPAVSGLVGVMIGALLVPPMLQLTLWASMSVASDTITAQTLQQQNTLEAFSLILVCLLLAALAPLALGLTMPKVVAAFAPAYSREVAGLRRALGQTSYPARSPALRLSRMTGRGAQRGGSAVARGSGGGAGSVGSRITPRPVGPGGMGSAVSSSAGLVRRGYSNVRAKLRTRDEPGAASTPDRRGAATPVGRSSRSAKAPPSKHAAGGSAAPSGPGSAAKLSKPAAPGGSSRSGGSGHSTGSSGSTGSGPPGRTSGPSAPGGSGGSSGSGDSSGSGEAAGGTP